MLKRFAIALLFSSAVIAFAQQPDAPPAGAPAQSSSGQVVPMDQTPVFKVDVISRTTEAVNYRHRGGATHVNFAGTQLMPRATGKGKVDSKTGRLDISASFDHMVPASTFGPVYLTYVLWAITPEGRAVNLGEVLPDDGKAGLHVTTDLQAFGMIVTAEPYFAVTRPSNMVVIENIIRPDTEGWEEHIDAKFDLLEKGAYSIVNPADLPSAHAAPKTPLDLLEAENAVAIARAAGADQYAPDTIKKADDFLARANDYLQRKQGRTPIGTVARGATQMAEDARVLTIQRKEQERIEADRLAHEKAEAEARARAQAAQAEAEAEAKRRAEADEQRLAAEKAQEEALRQQHEAEAERQAALAQQQAAQAEAEKARAAELKAEQDREQMRARLLQQLNQVLQTKDTDRGLVVNMSDVLFDLNRATLRGVARERLAKISGIVMAYPDLKFEIEGHTDSTGTPEYNVKLSEKRADAVRDYLVDQGILPDNITARGLGETDPVAPNNTAKGRQLNRRVELIVSGQSINTLGLAPAPASGTNAAPNTQPVPVSEPAPPSGPSQPN